MKDGRLGSVTSVLVTWGIGCVVVVVDCVMRGAMSSIFGRVSLSGAMSALSLSVTSLIGAVSGADCSLTGVVSVL